MSGPPLVAIKIVSAQASTIIDVTPDLMQMRSYIKQDDDFFIADRRTWPDNLTI